MLQGLVDAGIPFTKRPLAYFSLSLSRHSTTQVHKDTGKTSGRKGLASRSGLAMRPGGEGGWDPIGKWWQQTA
eukprot:4157811-Amphidinium_carterae.1